MLNRRETAKLVLFGAALPLVPSAAVAQSAKDWAEVLNFELPYHLAADADGELTLMQFGMGRNKKGTWMKAVVQLDWPPGFRRREFEVADKTDEETFTRLIGEIVETYSRAWPGKVV